MDLVKFLIICFVTLLSNGAAIQDLSGKIFIFPQETDTAHVKLTPAVESLSAVTVCHRSFSQLRRSHALFSLATPSSSDAFLIRMERSPVYCTVSVGGRLYYFTGIDYSPNKWHSICTTWDSASGLVQMWMDEQPLTFQYTTESPISGRPIIVLGQDHGFNAQTSFMGMLTDVHMWDRVLSPCEIQKFMNQGFTGNVLNWAALDFEIKGRVVIANKQTGCTCFN